MQVLDHYPVKFRRSGKPIAKSDIEVCESALGIDFPTPYVDFLLEHNGGSPSPAYLPAPGGGPKVGRFFSLAPDGLVDICMRLRIDFRLPHHLLPIADLGDSESFLLLDCSPKGTGRLYTWIGPEEGFRYQDDEYSNAKELYFAVSLLFLKFGPTKNREDRDGLFSRLYWSASDVGNGPGLARKFVAAGYDINYVLPTYRHPIFAAIDSEVFGVAEALIELGTVPTHTDPLHDNAGIEERLSEALDRFRGLVEAVTECEYDGGIKGSGEKMFKQKWQSVESAMSALARARG